MLYLPEIKILSNLKYSFLLLLMEIINKIKSNLEFSKYKKKEDT